MANVVVLLLSLLLQATPQELIEELRAERIQDRSSAQQKLIELGKIAVPDLERASRDPDLELARRAKIILRTIELKEVLTPAVLKAIPNAPELLASGTDQSYTAVFQKLVVRRIVGHASLDPIALPALRGADPRDRETILGLVVSYKLTSALPEVRRTIEDPRDPLGDRAILGLLALDPEAGKSLMLDLIRSREAPLRCRGLLGLDSLPGKEISDAVAGLLADPEVSVRRQALQTLNNRRDFDQLPRIVACLNDRDVTVMHQAAYLLISWEKPETIPLVLPLLQDPVGRVRTLSIEVLSQLRAADAAVPVVRLLQDPDASVRMAAALAVADLNSPGAGPRLAPLLSDKADRVRIAALSSSMQLGMPISNEDLLGFLMHEDSEVRLMGAWAAGLTRFPKAETSLLRILEDSESETVAMAAWAAGRCGARDAVPALLKLARMGNDAAQAAAAALAELADEKALPAMLELIETNNPAAVEAIAAACRRHPPTPAQMDGLIQKLAPGPFKSRVIALLGALGDARAVPALTRILADREEDGQTRGAAAIALARLRHTESIPALIETAKGSQPYPASSAVRALLILDARQSLPSLKPLLKTDHQGVFLAELFQAFEAFGADDQLTPLAGKLDDFSTPADLAAAGWLCRAGKIAGAEWISSNGEGLLPMNALRDPAAWKKLSAVSYTEAVEGTRFEIAARIAADAGMTLDFRRSQFTLDLPEQMNRHRIDPQGHKLRADEVLRLLMTKLDDDYDVVLDGNLLRILPSGKAHVILRNWLQTAKQR